MSTRDHTPTRRRLLEVGQQEIYLHGFQGASLENILRRAGVTKGAFFHHFASKTTFGYSVVEEMIAEMIAAQWVHPLLDSDDPLETIARGLGATPGQLALAWLLHRSQVMLPIPGTSSVAHLEDNVAAAGLRLTDAQFQALTSAV